jgi:hypothetical protein
MKDRKYIVFKRDELTTVLCQQFALDPHDREDARGLARVTAFYEEHALDDAVVIRTKDPLAGPALHAYAAGAWLPASILANFAAAEQAGNVKLLREVAEYFHARAVEADEYAAANQPKLPD